MAQEVGVHAAIASSANGSCEVGKKKPLNNMPIGRMPM
jgi:hypothetical protein